MIIFENWHRQILIIISKKAIISEIWAKIDIGIDLYSLFLLLSVENLCKPIIIFIYNKLMQVNEGKPIALLSDRRILTIILFNRYRNLISSISNKKLAR
jgi:hypothetical protein